MEQSNQQGNDREEDFNLEEVHLEGVVSSIDATIDHREGRTVYAADRKSADKVKGLLDTHVDRLRAVRNRPYFGRIDYSPAKSNSTRTVYVGDVHVLHDNPAFRIVNRNSPIARLYYRPSDGHYSAPAGNILASVLLSVP